MEIFFDEKAQELDFLRVVFSVGDSNPYSTDRIWLQPKKINPGLISRFQTVKNSMKK